MLASPLLLLVIQSPIFIYLGNNAMMEFMKEHMVETSKTPPFEIRSLMKKFVDDPIMNQPFLA